MIGGSLGGLTAALVLRDRGCEVEVHERSSAPLRDRGAGIVLHPATIRWLVESGARRVDELGVAVGTLRYLGPDGATAAELDCRYRFSSYSALYDDLRERLEPERYRLGSEIAAFEDEGPAVAVEPAEGPRRRYDMLVCADGVRSSYPRSSPSTPATWPGGERWASRGWTPPRSTRCTRRSPTT